MAAGVKGVVAKFLQGEAPAGGSTRCSQIYFTQGKPTPGGFVDVCYASDQRIINIAEIEEYLLARCPSLLLFLWGRSTSPRTR